MTALLERAFEEALAGRLEWDPIRVRHRTLLRQLELPGDFLDRHLFELRAILGRWIQTARDDVGPRATGYFVHWQDVRSGARMMTLRLRQRPTRSTVEHREIMTCILEGDADRARETFRRHREQSARELLEILENLRLHAI